MVRFLPILALVVLAQPAGAEPNECAKLARRASVASGLSVANSSADEFTLKGKGDLAAGEVSFTCRKRTLFAGWAQPRAKREFVDRVAKAAIALDLVKAGEADDLERCQTDAFMERRFGKEISRPIGNGATLVCQSGNAATIAIRAAR